MAVAVRLATEPDDPSVVHDAVDDRGGHVAVAEHLAPPSELQVRGGHHAPLLVGIRDDLEQEPGPVDVDRQVAQIVDDQKPGAAYRAQFRVEPVLVPRPPQTHHQRRRGEEPHRHAPLARQHARSDRHVRLAASNVAVEHEVLGPVHETEVHELLAPPQSAGNDAMPQSYPSKPLTHGNPAFLISLARLDSVRLAFWIGYNVLDSPMRDE